MICEIKELGRIFRVCTFPFFPLIGVADTKV